MPDPIVLWRWRIRDERTGRWRETRYHMTEAEALTRHPGAQKIESSRQERHDLRGNGYPGTGASRQGG